MAFIGMRHVVAAPISQATEGTAITYGAGFVVGKAIQGNLTWNRNSNPLYADDTIAEDDNGAAGATLELGVDDLLDTVREKLLGETAVTVGTGSTATTEYETTEGSAPYVGIGYMRVRRKGSSTTYQAVWFHKAQFAENNENAQTKGKNIEWQTPTLSGTIFGVNNSASGTINFRRRASFDTAAAAISWLDSKAGITAQNNG